ncbi:biopolymer transporter ExbD [uncultured Roseobacter sp.]|uniref:ExbD/TolR family protein n=1 Tax=uncultured Roseobacter sp. TaxID=114847 RepID=UPI002617322D|nr:biopolymer transporter ExbD [uncultured Roseobacter sp.]
MRKAPLRRKREPTIALINIVFLMLVFFLVAGTLAPPLDPSLSLVKTRDLEGRPPPDALIIHSDGTLSFRGADQSDAETYVQSLSDDARAVVRILPDRDLPAATLVAVGRALSRGGAGQVMIITERGLQ